MDIQEDLRAKLLDLASLELHESNSQGFSRFEMDITDFFTSLKVTTSIRMVELGPNYPSQPEFSIHLRDECMLY